jgi:beta-phosphoglucomutase-like phosphatase (HAD superfamily)
MKQRPRGILFDLDGVLIDSYAIWFHLLNQTARELGYSEITPERYRESWGQSTLADRDRFFPEHSVADVERFYQAHYFEHLEHLVVPEEVPEIFGRLREERIATAVVTNTQKSLATTIVERSGATPDLVVGGGDAPRGKPAPDSLLLASRLLCVGPEESWMVGDTKFDREAAAGAGIWFVGLGIEGDVRVEALSGLLALLGLNPRAR